jgi:hypothetical protein
VAVSDGKRLLAQAGPDAAQATLAALVGREDRAGESGVVTWRMDAGRGDRAGSRSVAGRGVAARAAPAGSIWVWSSARRACCWAAPASSAAVGRRRAKVDSDNPMVITRPMGSGQRRVRPPSNRSNVPRICVRPATGRWCPSRAAPAAPAAAAAMMETPPAGAGVTLGRYRLLERIGEGGMAEIFIATAHGAEGFVRYFVVKRMHPHLARSRDAVNQFIDEGRCSPASCISNIVPVFDFGAAARSTSWRSSTSTAAIWNGWCAGTSRCSASR